jgi:DNA-binding MurR/RpiR family transcriptional regulator
MVLAQTGAHGNGVSQWIDSLAARTPLSGKALAVINVLTAQPRMASYASVREVAASASLSSGTVTRTAQALGFSGWPSLQAELRTHYLASLSAVELAEERVGDSQLPAFASLTRDRDNLNVYSRVVDLSQLQRVAQVMTSARCTYVVSGGSFLGVGQIFAHGAQLHGYDVRLLSEPAQLANTLSTVTSDDVVFGLSFWRPYESTVQAIESAHARSATVVFLTDAASQKLDKVADEIITIPAEGAGFSPSLTVATAVVHSLVAEMAAVNPAHTARSISRAEEEWSRFNLMHRYE